MKFIQGLLLSAFIVATPLATQTVLQAQNKGYEQKLFDAALGFTLYFEGGFSDHPADKGGRTYKGIIQAEYNNYRAQRGLPSLDVTQISEAELLEIYQGYWNSSEAATMHPTLAIVMFDTAVNFGIENSITFLQQALGLPQTGKFDTETLAP